MRNKSLVLVLAAAAALFFGAPTLAFHDAGVAHCNGCHTMHASAANPADTEGGNAFLLKESNSTDTCTRCHNTSYGNSWGASVLAPGNVYGGGQFVFLLEDNLNDGHAGSDPDRWIPGERAGHNVISVDKGTVADSVNTTAPGGDYSGANLHCTSCHDPHGQGGHFRLLYGTNTNTNVDPQSFAMGYPFTYTTPAPTGAGIGFFGPNSESNSNHTAYQDGMSEWCANCHGDFHNADGSVFRHKSGAGLGSTIAANYNVYEGSGNYTGDGTDAYLALVPFEEATMTTDYVASASSTSTVMCLSCHRAHASSAPYAGRWDFNVTLCEEEGVESGAYAIPNPYAATAGGHQRSLCNKCHLKDPVL